MVSSINGAQVVFGIVQQKEKSKQIASAHIII